MIETVLGNYFMSSNFKSFCRQLNLYGFQKVKNLRGWHEFKHEAFRRDQPELWYQIKKKPTRLLFDTTIISKLKSADFSLAEECAKFNEQIEGLKSCLEQAKLQKETLVKKNIEIIESLLFKKGISLLKVQKIMYLFFMLCNQYSPQLMYPVRASFMTPTLLNTNERINLFDILMKLNNDSQSLCKEILDTEVSTCPRLDHAVDIMVGLLTTSSAGSTPDVFGPYCKEIAEWIGEYSLINRFIDSATSIQEIYSVIDNKIHEFVGQLGIQSERFFAESLGSRQWSWSNL
jgi:hypothetical protein